VVKGKVKVHPKTGNEDPDGQSLFLTSALEKGDVQPHPSAA